MHSALHEECALGPYLKRHYPKGKPPARLFWFFESSNPEAVVKVLNACSINNHFWVFGAAAN